ncbi:3-hydroxyacyl-CoA dehydrogenase NAD-binding domain-containing protein [Microvirga pakistanensis]|uniref:3-hydroxyacyl-CoA dehydrogenase NAD-binding domain-containing protein n=1 Tax=Microvirga pakistanensis TaxID=1682650 RepID=UPI0010698596|nr:3-hydroxyacyl-CoA dehydrogenase NAD-binding domain-containing protein [Microvirga pakistanensis]
MPLDATRTDLTLGIVGAGIMGRGIAQVAAEAGITVLLADVRPEAVAEAVAFWPT